MMHLLNRPYPTLTEIQALHQLASSAASPATAKLLNDSKNAHGLSGCPSGSSPIPLDAADTSAPAGPGIAPHTNVLIKPHPPVLLSQTLVKDHPQKAKIITIAKALFDSDLPKIHQSRSGKDYLRQALKIVDPAGKSNMAQYSV